MRERIGRVLVGCLPALLLVGSWFGTAGAVECVSQDVSVDCHRTIQDALGAAAPGEEIAVYPGGYGENVSVDTADVRIVGQGGWPGDVVISAADGVVVSLNAPRVTLKNVSVAGGVTGIAVAGAGTTIEDVVVHSGAAGVSVAADGVRVLKSAVRLTVGPGIEAAGADFSLLASIVQQTGGQCVGVNGNRALIQGNRFIDCGAGGVRIRGGAASVTRNQFLVAASTMIDVEGPRARVNENTLQGGRTIAMLVLSDALAVVDNTVSDCESGIDVQCASCAGALLARNKVSGVYDCPGIDAQADSVGLMVEDNFSRGSSDAGLHLRGVGIVARRNTAVDNGGDGIQVIAPATRVKLYDNVTHSNAHDGIHIPVGVTNTVLKRNRARGNRGVDFFDAGTGTILGTGDDRNFFWTTGP